MLRFCVLTSLFVQLLASPEPGGTGEETPLEIVVAHFNEDLSWLAKLVREDPAARNAHVKVYAKGQHEMPRLAEFPEAQVSSQTLANVGREAHTYLSHIVNNYDDLAQWTVFTQAGEPSFGYKGHSKGGGHLLAGDKFSDFLHPQSSGSRFVYTSAVHLPSMNHVLRASFCIDDANLEPSKLACPEHSGLWSDWLDIGLFSDFIMSKVQSQNGLHPMEYYRRYVNPHHQAAEVIIPFAQGSRFAVSKEKILSRPKEQYAALLETLSHNEDPYSGYFMEWLWSELFLGSETHCELPQRKLTTSHADAMNNLITRYRKGLNSYRPTSTVRWVRSLAISGISGISGDTTASTGGSSQGQTAGATTTRAASDVSSVAVTTVAVTTTAAVQSSSASQVGSDLTAPITTSAAITSTTGSSRRVKSTQVLGTVTITVPNCVAFTSEANSVSAVRDGLKSKFLKQEVESQGVSLTVTLLCSSRRLSDRRLSGDALAVNYVIDIPSTATTVNANDVESTIMQTKPDALTTSIKSAVSNYTFQNSYDLAVNTISTPSRKTVLADPARDSAGNRLPLTIHILLCVASSSMLMAWP
jgi:hypothetical protein